MNQQFRFFRLAVTSLLVLLLHGWATVACGGTWSSKFVDGLDGWNNPRPWGMENLSYVTDDGVDGRVLRVAIDKGSIDPATMRTRGLPVSGSGFKARIIEGGANHALLTYKVRFPSGFQFVRGGKLPGLFGGIGNSGGKIPDGTDGFSFRIMWLANGRGRIYAYLPSSKVFGTPLLEGMFQFVPGRWHLVSEELVLNSPGQSNGSVRLWLDNDYVGSVSNLMVRSVSGLKIDGIFFDVFFGGNDDSWAAQESTHIDFAEFKVRWW